jgi:hypothetical protein
MTSKLHSYEFTSIPESEQLGFRFQLRDEQQSVEFLVPAHAMKALIEDLTEAQRRYKRARDQHIRNRKKQIRVVVKDDDV